MVGRCSVASELETVLGLLQAGEDVRARTLLSASNSSLWKDRLWDGSTWLHIAADAGCVETCRWLIERGVNVNDAGLGTVTLEHTQTPLSLASGHGGIELVKLLLDSGSWIDGAPLELASPLMIASIEGHQGVVELLLDRGAEINRIHSRWDKTPVDIALERGHQDVVEALQARGGIGIRGDITWDENTPDIQLIRSVEAKIGSVIPFALSQNVPEVDGIHIRIASISKSSQHKLVFTSGLSKFGLTEVAACLPKSWPLNSSGMRVAEYSWPVALLLRLANSLSGSRRLQLGHVTEESDEIFDGLKAPFSRLLLVDQANVAIEGMSIAVPLSKTTKVSLAGKEDLLEKYRKATWSKLALCSI